MKIYPCTTEKPEAPKDEFPLTWEEVQATEGVYRAQRSSDARFITIESNGRLATLILQDNGELHIAGDWSRHNFRRTSERLCMEVRA